MAEAIGRGGFPETRHSIVRGVASQDEAERSRAFGALVESYWRPVYKYARLKWGLPREDAEDLTQAFFARALEKAFFDRYDPAQARFRTFLRTCLDGFAANDWKAARRLKRGGGAQTLSLDGRYTSHRHQGSAAASRFERAALKDGSHTTAELHSAATEKNGACAHRGRDRCDALRDRRPRPPAGRWRVRPSPACRSMSGTTSLRSLGPRQAIVVSAGLLAVIAGFELRGQWLLYKERQATLAQRLNEVREEVRKLEAVAAGLEGFRQKVMQLEERLDPLRKQWVHASAVEAEVKDVARAAGLRVADISVATSQKAGHSEATLTRQPRTLPRARPNPDASSARRRAGAWRHVGAARAGVAPSDE